MIILLCLHLMSSPSDPPYSRARAPAATAPIPAKGKRTFLATRRSAPLVELLEEVPLPEADAAAARTVVDPAAVDDDREAEVDDDRVAEEDPVEEALEEEPDEPS